MKILINIALHSLLNRKITVLLTIISLTVSIVLFLSIDTLRLGTKKSFFGNVKSGDLILGSRSGEIQLLLYSLFQIGVQVLKFQQLLLFQSLTATSLTGKWGG